MAYYPDLSTYIYRGTHPETLNIGWLSKDHDFPTGSTPVTVIERLTNHLDVVANQTRGLHPCNFCDDKYGYRAEGNFGSAEFRIFGQNGDIFAAPTLIIHYIAAHGYRPPHIFVDAVLAGPERPDEAYLERLRVAGIDYVNWMPFREKYPDEF